MCFLTYKRRARGPQRVANGGVILLDEPLEILALHSAHNGAKIPATGRELRNLGGEFSAPGLRMLMARRQRFARVASGI
jgi:hypothetical protein